MVRSMDPPGPFIVAPMVEPCSAVTEPVSCPQVIWLDDMATPPLTAVPMSLTTSGVGVAPEGVMVKTTDT